MKKVFLLAIIAGLSFSCGKKVAEENKNSEKKEEVKESKIYKFKDM